MNMIDLLALCDPPVEFYDCLGPMTSVQTRASDAGYFYGGLYLERWAVAR